METKNESNLLFSKNIQEIEDKDNNNVELLIAENISLVKRLVYRLGFPASEFDDFVSVGYIGLIKAARTYDINKDYAFSTYAGKCINNEIIMYVRKHYKNGGISHI